MAFKLKKIWEILGKSAGKFKNPSRIIKRYQKDIMQLAQNRDLVATLYAFIVFFQGAINGYGWERARARPPKSSLALKTILWWRPRNGGQNASGEESGISDDATIVGKRWRLNQSEPSPLYPNANLMTSIAINNEDDGSIAFIDDEPSSSFNYLTPSGPVTEV